MSYLGWSVESLTRSTVDNRKRTGYQHLREEVLQRANFFILLKLSSNGEPLMFMSQERLYATYRKDLKKWKNNHKMEENYMLRLWSTGWMVTSLRRKSRLILEKKMEGNKQGVEVLLQFLDNIYLKDGQGLDMFEEKIDNQKIYSVSLLSMRESC